VYVINAFTRQPFGGNPAAVMPLSQPLPERLMQQVAAQHNVSETAFYHPDPSGDSDFCLRWFTPTLEVDLCGHATLAAAWVVFHEGWTKEEIHFSTKSGVLRVWKLGSELWLDLPTLPVVSHPDGLKAVEAALGVKVLEVLSGQSKWLAVVDSVKHLQPNMAAIAALPTQGLIATAAGQRVDFVSRYFAPQVGIAEDPVTGSAHCVLAAFWSERLFKGSDLMLARQLSARGGDISCRHWQDRTHIGGEAVLYLKGHVCL
jgi:predicted PhzF superfamily epimerase YddE/YHI9